MFVFCWILSLMESGLITKFFSVFKNSCAISHLKVYNSGSFSLFTLLCKHHHFLVLRLFHHPGGKPLCLWVITAHSPLPLTSWLLLICFWPLWTCLIWTYHTEGVIQYVTLGVRFLSLSLMFLRFIQVIASTYFVSFHGWIIFYGTLCIHHVYIMTYPFIS